MKRLWMPAVALLGIFVIGLIATTWLLNRDALRDAVEAQIRTATGLDLVVNGEIDVSVFPGSYVTLHKVGLKGGGQIDPALTVESLTANLRLLPLLLQRFEISDVTLINPRIGVKRDQGGGSNWTPIVEVLARTIKPGVDSPVSFSEIRIKDGILAYEDDESRVVESVSGIDLSLAWPSISRSFAATGQFNWRGERIDGSLSIGDFVAALSGERSSIKTRITSGPLKFAFDGVIANRASLMMEGTLTADAASLRNALRWAGQDPPGAGGLGRFALRARANVVGASLALTNVNLELDGNVAEGVITYTNNGRATLQATLAAEALDFTSYLSTLRLLASGARDWNRGVFDLRALSANDLDMRLSAAKVTVGATKLGRTALGVNLRGGTLALSVGEAQIFGGVVRGSFGVARSDAVADIKAQVQFTDVDLEAGASELFGVRKLSGRGNLSVAVEATGSSPFGLAQSLDGTAVLTGRNGALNGFNVEQLLRRLERRPLSGSGEFRTGRTPYNNLNVAIRFNDGVATAEDVRIEGTTARITLTGMASVPARDYDLKGVASLLSTSNAPTFELPFVIQGPWDDPLIFPDSESLLRRSPASAPLLDAVRDRRTRDAVRSAIERLSGAAKSAPETPGAVPAPALIAPPSPSVGQN